MSRPGAFLLLTRPGNVGIAALAVAVGGWTGARGISDWVTMGWAMAAAALITAAGNTLNDVADVAVDRINKPHRPLPSGAVNRTAATLFAILLFAAGLAATIPLPAGCRLIAVVAVGGVVLYDLWGKGQPLIGNFLVALISSFAFPFGSIAVARWPWGLIPAGLAFLFHFAREIVKDLEDMEADRVVDLRTFPLGAGKGAAVGVARGTLILLAAALFVPWAAGWLGIGYLVVAVAGVGIPVLYVAFALDRDATAERYGQLATILKWDMLVGLAAIVTG